MTTNDPLFIIFIPLAGGPPPPPPEPEEKIPTEKDQLKDRLKPRQEVPRPAPLDQRPAPPIPNPVIVVRPQDGGRAGGGDGRSNPSGGGSRPPPNPTRPPLAVGPPPTLNRASPAPAPQHPQPQPGRFLDVADAFCKSILGTPIRLPTSLRATSGNPVQDSLKQLESELAPIYVLSRVMNGLKLNPQADLPQLLQEIAEELLASKESRPVKQDQTSSRPSQAASSQSRPKEVRQVLQKLLTQLGITPQATKQEAQQVLKQELAQRWSGLFAKITERFGEEVGQAIIAMILEDPSLMHLEQAFANRGEAGARPPSGTTPALVLVNQARSNQAAPAARQAQMPTSGGAISVPTQGIPRGNQVLPPTIPTRADVVPLNQSNSVNAARPIQAMMQPLNPILTRPAKADPSLITPMSPMQNREMFTPFPKQPPKVDNIEDDIDSDEEEGETGLQAQLKIVLDQAARVIGSVINSQKKETNHDNA